MGQQINEICARCKRNLFYIAFNWFGKKLCSKCRDVVKCGNCQHFSNHICTNEKSFLYNKEGLCSGDCCEQFKENKILCRTCKKIISIKDNVIKCEEYECLLFYGNYVHIIKNSHLDKIVDVNNCFS